LIEGVRRYPAKKSRSLESGKKTKLESGKRGQLQLESLLNEHYPRRYSKLVNVPEIVNGPA
jgi:hypothetical protein